MSLGLHQNYNKLKYWQKQYQLSRPQQNKLKHQNTKVYSCLKFDNHLTKSKISSKKKTQRSLQQSSFQSSQSQSNCRKTKKHCCSKKRLLIQQSNQIQRFKNYHRPEKQYQKAVLPKDHVCGYKLSECPLIQHYLKNIQNHIRHENQKRLALQRQNKQLARQNKFFNQYYQTFQQKIKENKILKKSKSKIKINYSKSFKPEQQQADYCTFQKLIFSPRSSNVKSSYQERHEQQKCYKNEQPSQITRSSYHKNQHQNSCLKLSQKKKYQGYKK